MAAPGGSACAGVIDSFPDRCVYRDGRDPLTLTFDTDRWLARSTVNRPTCAMAVAVSVAVPDSRLLATLYSRSSS